MTGQAYTGFPAIDARIPPFAPILGAMTLPRVQSLGEVSGEPAREGDVQVGTGGDPREPLPEIILGVLTASGSGAVTGGLAAGSWYGAGVGAAINTGLWGLFTLVGSWRTTGTKTKIVLGTAALVGTTTAVGMFLGRRR